MTRLRVDVLTIFPELIRDYAAVTILGRAQREGYLELQTHDLRDGASDARRTVDDSPFGGGAGMVLSPEPIFRVVEEKNPPRPIIFLSPTGRRFDQSVARELARDAGGFSLLCGRYEGIDQRVIDELVDDELSIGDFVLAGGELGALTVIEAVTRLLPGVLGNEESVVEESFSAGLLEYPQYTRPAEYRGKAVPAVLLGGDHQAVAKWRLAASLAKTMERRPDLIEARGGLSVDEVTLLSQHGYSVGTAAPESARIFQAASSGDAFVEERKKI
jgi:tRNA (guanine37-N1)-methyltransferase